MNGEGRARRTGKETTLTIKNPNCSHEHRPGSEAERSLVSTLEYIPPANPLMSLMGLWPGDINDGFEEAIREMRDSELVDEPPSWWWE
jgi:hypothetical protein